MKTKLLSIILIGVSFIANAQTSIPGGNVYGTWTLTGSPYLIQGSIFIPQDSLLTIQSGVTVNFQGTYKLLVLGRLLAIGTAADTITFTAANTTNGWKGIRFDNTSATNDTSKIYYCKLQYGNANGTSPDDNGGAFYFNYFSKVIISNCLISNWTADNNGGGIFCYYSSPTISNNTIVNNSSSRGGGIYCHSSGPSISNNLIANNTSYFGGGIVCESSSPTISNNTISNNTADYAGGGINCYGNSSPTISNNTISNNTSLYYTTPSYGGGGIFCASSSPTISNNTISNNTASDNGGGIYCYGGSNPAISNNTISNNTGSGIYCYGYSDPTITNNTIANNSAVNGGALYCTSTSNPTLHNTILWGNTASTSGQQVYLDDEGSDPNFYYCDVQGDATAFELNNNIYLGTYQNNINTNPLFVSPSGGSGTGFNGVTADWSLQNTSLCIDAGNPIGTYPATDKAGNPRVVGSFIDIGAFEFQGSVGIASYDSQNQIIVFPNPFSCLTTLRTDNLLHNATLTVDNCFGQTVKQIKNISGQTVVLSRDNLSSGLYFIRLTQDNKFITADKLVITD